MGYRTPHRAVRTRFRLVLALSLRQTPRITSKQNMVARRHPMRVLAWLLATACAAHAGEATEAASATADQFKLTIGSVLMSDYIFRGNSSHKR
jgi:hypothetical protein